MGSIPLAFSVHHFINSVGSDAGFASIIGLAVLILLYFAQARETASLRNHAYEAAQRIQDLESRLAAQARDQPAAAPAPQAAKPQAVGSPGRAVPALASTPAKVPAMAAPIAPAGVAAPALTAATRLIPVPAAAPVALSSAKAPDSTVIAAAPATVAGAANGTAERVAPPPRPVSAPAATQTPPPPIQAHPGESAGPARRPAPPVYSPAPQGGGRFGTGKVLLALVGLLAVGGAIALLVILTNPGGSSPSAGSSSRTTNAPGKKSGARASAVVPSSVTVAVLNATATAGLAHRVALNLSNAGYKEGTIATAPDQTRTTTTVAYLQGNRRDAVAVANSLRLRPQSSVQPIDQPTQLVACPPPAACTANVVVTVGSDLANTQ